VASPFVAQRFDPSVAASGNSAAEIAQGVIVGPGAPLGDFTTLAILVVTVAGLLILRRNPDPGQRRGAEFALSLTVPGCVVVMLFLTFHIPIQGRYLLALWLPATIGLAAGLGSRHARRLGVATTGVLCAMWSAVAIAAATVPRFSGREDSRGPARALGAARTGRLIAIDQPWDLLALGLYRPAARVYSQPRAVVRELDLIAMPRRGFPAFSDAIRPAPPRLRGLPSALILRQVIRGATFVLERYTSSTPVTLELAPAAGTFSGLWRFLYEPAGGSVASL
jgi:hypothetical protein